MTETITTSSPRRSQKATRKYTSKRPLCLVLAIIFFLAAALPVMLVAKPVETPVSEAPVMTAQVQEAKILTLSEKMEVIASTIETACYSDGTKSMHELFLYGTWTAFICIVVSSLILGLHFLTLYLSIKLNSMTRTCLLAAGTITAITAIGVFVIMHIYSSVVITGEFKKINAQGLETTVKDQKITETLTYLFRNLIVTFGLAFFAYKFASFAFATDNSKLSLKKLRKLTKGYKSASVALAMICLFFALTIALTWTFDFSAKTLLWMLVAGMAVFFALTAFLYDYHKFIKKCIAAQAETENPTDTL